MSRDMMKCHCCGCGGVIIPPPEKRRDFLLKEYETQEPFEDVDCINALVVADVQTEGSCVSRATMAFAECMYRLAQGVNAIPYGYQLPAKMVYWEARKEFAPSSAHEDKGLQLDWAARTAIRLGVLPPDTKIIEIEPNLSVLVEWLKKGPIIQAHLVAQEWLHASKKNGWIVHCEPDIANTLGGHATLLVEHRFREGRHILGFANSWRRWGWHNIGRMEWKTWVACWRWMIQWPIALVSDQWQTWTGYKNCLVKHEET